MILNKISSFVATSSGRTSTRIKAALSTSSSFVIQGQRSHITTTSFSEKNDNNNDIIPSMHSIQPQPITQFTEEERMVQQSIRIFSQNVTAPVCFPVRYHIRFLQHLDFHFPNELIYPSKAP